MTQESIRVHGNWAILAYVLQVTVCTFRQFNLTDTWTISLDKKSLREKYKILDCDLN